MTRDIATALVVLVAQGLVYALPSWLVVRRWGARGPWPLTLLVALLLGLVSQSLCGFIWSRCVPGAAAAEGAVYLVLWLLLASASLVWRRPDSFLLPAAPLSRHGSAGLVGILLLALVVRSLHPLQSWALGQSDAYTHLTMLRELLAQGRLTNSGYPPGYSWILALPTALLGVDPYFTARFGGAFFGAALVLAVFVLMREGGGDLRVALFGAFFVACFPGLMLLLKTGVGTFANQLGLLLVPSVFLGFLLTYRPLPLRRASWTLMATALLGLLLSVPMMALHVILVLAGAQLLFLAWHDAADRRMLRRLLWLSPAVVALGLLPLLGTGRTWLVRSVIVLTQADEAFVAAPIHPDTLDVGSAWLLLVRDFFGIKRWGLHQPLFDAALLALFALFLGSVLWGFRRRQRAWLLLGCWGGLTTVQTALGVLQFTAYQREGWSLLIAIACLGGLVAAALWSWTRWLRPIIAAGMVCSAGWTLVHPPAHVLANSTAEEDLVHIARMLREYPRLRPDSDAAAEIVRGVLIAHSATNQPLAVMTRPLMQEFMLSAVAGPLPSVTFTSGSVYRNVPGALSNAWQTLVLVDQRPLPAAGSPDLLAMVSPEVTRNYWRQQDRDYNVNDWIVTCVRRLAPPGWRVEERAVTDRLRAFFARRDISVNPLMTNPR